MEMNRILDIDLYDGSYTHCRECGKKLKHKDIVFSYVGDTFRGVFFHYMCFECGNKFLDNLHDRINNMIIKKQELEEN
jgi:hypothetical protein